MRILLLSSGAIPAPPRFGGGVEGNTYHLVRALARRGATVDFVSSLAPEAEFPPGVTTHPQPVFRFRIQSSYPMVAVSQALGAVSVTGAARRLIARAPPDVLSVHTNATAVGTVPVARAHSVRTSFTVHNPTPATLRPSSPLRASARRVSYRLMDEPAMRAVDGLVVLNRAMESELRGRLGPGGPATSVIPLGVDLDRFAPGAPDARGTLQRYRLEPGYCLFVGRLIEQKGVPYLLEAIRSTRWNLVVVGDGPERGSILGRVEELRVGDRVRFLDRVPQEDLPAIYRGARVLALPSLAEGLPTVGIEALAAGLPIVASRIPGMDDIVQDGDNGALVPPRDGQALGRALERFEDPATASRAGLRSRERAVRYYSWDSVADRTLEFYRRLLGEPAAT